MTVNPADYELLLSEYSNRQEAITLLRQYRPYLELIPSLRRPEESLVTIPFPLIRLRHPKEVSHYPRRETLSVPCDIALVMCDPEWKIKLGAEILLFIHRPHEEFSELLSRWRKTQIYLDQDYEWIMPPREAHMFSEGADQIHPLFVLLEQSSSRLRRGLEGSGLPYLILRTSELKQPLVSNLSNSEVENR